MPKTLEVDWKLVEADYLRGTRVVDLALLYQIKPSTLEARIRRGAWTAKRMALREALSCKQTERTLHDISNRAGSYLERVVKEVDKGMDVLGASIPGTVKEVDAHFEALGKIDKIARPTLGLASDGKSSGGGIINIAVLQGVSQKEAVKNCQEAIEVQSKPLG